MRVVIIGNGSSGATCAFELRRLNKDMEIEVLDETSYTQYSPCALPYVISREIEDFKKIFIFKENDYISNNIKLHLNTRITEIDKKSKSISYVKDNKQEKINYDKLVIATGSSCNIPKIKGINNCNYHVLKNIDDTKRIAQNIKPKSLSVIIGAGLIGVELAISLSSRGEQVKLIEAKNNILPSMLDSDIGSKLKENIENIQKLMPFLDENVQEGLITMEKVKVIKYRHDKNES